MKLKQLLWISIFFIGVKGGELYSESLYYSDRNIDVTYSNMSIGDLKELSMDIEKVSDYFNSLYMFKPHEPLLITIMPTVWDLTSTFNVSSQVGAVWVDGQSFFQPIDVLKNKKKYIKTIFTEYSHFFIESYTQNNCPNWLKEGISYYLWLQYSGESSITGNRVNDINFLKDFSLNLNNSELMKDFYYNFLIYVDSQIDEPNDIFSLIDNKLSTDSCFIITEVETDKIVFQDNYSFSNKMLFPGSLLKPFTILALKNNDINTIYKCSGWSNKDSRCWSRESHGEINLINALAYSCNSFFIQYLKDRLSINDYYKTLSRYLKFSGNLTSNDYIKDSIGLGINIKTTPINMLKAYNKIFREEPKDIDIVRQGMKEAAYYGTGKSFVEITEEYDIICKTGTSYRILPNERLDYNSNTGWFLFLYPADSPKYSFLKVIDSSKSGLSVKEAAHDFLRWINEN